MFIGIDVSKARLDVAIRPSAEKLSVSNDEAGIQALVMSCPSRFGTRVK